MLQKNFFERRPQSALPSSRPRKSLLLEISSAVSFYSRELKLLPKCRQMNKLYCDIKIIGG